MKSTIFAALLAAVALFASPARAETHIEAGADAGVLSIGGHDYTAARVYVGIPLTQFVEGFVEKGDLRWETALVSVNNTSQHNYDTMSSVLAYSYKTEIGVIYEAHLGIADASSTVYGQHYSAASATYGVGVRYMLIPDRIVARATVDRIGKFRDDSFNETSGTMLTVGVGYAF